MFLYLYLSALFAKLTSTLRGLLIHFETGWLTDEIATVFLTMYVVVRSSYDFL